MDETIMDPNFSPEESGWVLKQSDWLKNWKKKFIMLSKNKLYMSDGPNIKPNDEIDLTSGFSVKSRIEEIQRDVYKFEAMSQDQLNLWIGALARSSLKNILLKQPEE